MSDITIAGATFSDVTKIQIPKSGSGTAEFVEVSGSQEITQNNTYDVSALAQVVVNVSGGGGGGSWETESGTWTPSVNTDRGEITFSNAHSEAPSIIALVSSEETLPSSSNSNRIFNFALIRFKKLLGYSYPAQVSDGHLWDTAAFYSARGTSNASFSVNHRILDSEGDDQNHLAYWATNESFHPRAYSSSYKFIAGVNYKWFALWKKS